MTQQGWDSAIRSNVSGSWGTATDGQAWDHPRGSSNLNVSSNELTCDTASGFTNFMRLGGSSKSIGDIDLRVRFIQATTTDIAGVGFSYTATTDWYSLVVGNSAGLLEIRDDKAGSFSTVASASFTTTAGTAYWIRVAKIGSSIWGKIWADGTAEPNSWNINALNTVTNSDHPTGNFGIVCNPSSSSAVKFDSFYVTDYIQTEDLVVSDIGRCLQQWGIDSNTLSDIGGTQQWGVDSLTISDLLPGLQQWGIDSSPATDLGGMQQWGVDGITADDSASTFADTTLFVDSNNITDIGALQTWSVDGLATSDAATYTDAAIFVDALTIADPSVQNTSFSGVDALTASDVTLFTDNAVPVDALVATDAALYTDNAIFVDGMVASDTGGLSQGVANNDMSGTDSLVISDIGGLQSWTVDSLATGDASLFTGNATIVDSIPAADIGGLRAWQIDALMITDAFIATDNALLADSNVIGDTSLQVGTFSGIDALIIVDIGVLQAWVVDALMATDIGGLQQWGIDGLTITDSVLFVDTAILIESNALSDTGGIVSGAATLVTAYVVGTGRDGIIVGTGRDGMAIGKGV